MCLTACCPLTLACALCCTPPPLLLLPAWWWGHRDQLQLGEPDWDYAHFLQQHLADYLVMTQRFMDECFASDGGQQQQQQ